ncbi:MAG: glutamate 5-kinase, partial [Deltaproteobacteria bacterium RIFOXYD12_FULL_53_23]
SVEELRFGDNDALGAMVTNLTEADLLVCLTDVSGLFSANPLTNPEARPVYTVVKIDSAVQAMAGKRQDGVGTGGMGSKVKAAKMVAARGGCCFIGPGREPDTISRLFAGELIGTFFLPQDEKLASRKHWIAYTLRPLGALVLDAGACKAVLQGGKSLLPSGILEVQGKFGIGAPVHCLNEQGEPLAAGLVNYASGDIDRIKGVKTNQIEQVLERAKDSDEVIHRDNLVIL